MPRYNLNHQDIKTIVDALNDHKKKCQNLKDYNRIMNLRSRLLIKLNLDTSPQTPPPNDYSDIDVWEAFR